MSTITTTTRPKPTASSLVSSVKFKTFAVTFAVVGTLTYFLCLQFDWPLFTYYPAVNRFEWGWGRSGSGEGVAMHWFGLIATTLIVGVSAGFLAILFSENVTKKIPLFLVWLLPILSIPYLIWHLRQWWFHP
jgi:hypothetical protein